jgi:stearoyl-CoA desaturase (delta-9 desaturase)
MSEPHVEKQHPDHETLDRVVNLTVTIGPLLLLGLAVWQTWNGALHWHDVVVFAVMYIPIGLGVTVGFHRLFTHRSFKTGPVLRFIFGALGSAALEGPVIEWVAIHRRHHAFADQEGDPHSPHLEHRSGIRGALRGLFHAHVGWILFATEMAQEERYAPDLLRDPIMRFVSRTHLVWVAVGLALPFGLGCALTGRVSGGLTGLLWGGAIRILLLHHVTYSINSLCHFFGRRRFAVEDESRNLAWLSVLSFGESWHHNHHAFPTSAAHGFRWWEVDPSAMVIRMLEKLGLAWDVVRITPERQLTKALAPS